MGVVSDEAGVSTGGGVCFSTGVSEVPPPDCGVFPVLVMSTGLQQTSWELHIGIL